MGSSVSKGKTGSRGGAGAAQTRMAATFPGDPDHGKVVMVSDEGAKRGAKRARRVQCYLDVAIDGEAAGRVQVEVRGDVKPRTGENFRALCTGERGGLTYRGCRMTRIVPGFVVQGGDVELKGTRREGRGGTSIYGRSFADEKVDVLSHVYGAVSMASAGPHTANSQFMIVVDPEGAAWLDGKHTVFGMVSSEESLEVLRKVERCAEVFERGGQRRARIAKSVTIVDCGELP